MTPRPTPDATDSYGPLPSFKPEEDKIDGNGRNVLQSKSLLAYIFTIEAGRILKRYRTITIFLH